MTINDEITIAGALLAAGMAGLIGHAANVAGATLITLVLFSTYQLVTVPN